MKLKLTAITRHGHNKINQHGNVYEVLKLSMKVSCLNNRPGFLIESLENTCKLSSKVWQKDWRWIACENDMDFNFTIVDGV